MQQKNTVATPRQEINESLERGQLVRDLMGGTVAMQRAGARYILRREGESDTKHRGRIMANVLFNGYKRTVNYLSGQVFSKDVALTSEPENAAVLEPFASMAEDIDFRGNNLSVWAKDFFLDAINEGAGLVLVEFPQVETRRNGSGRLEYLDAETGEWRAKTQAEDERNGWRPYFVQIPQSRILGWRTEYRNGKMVLTQLRFKEDVTTDYGEWDVDDTQEEQVRVLFPGGWQVWRKKKTTGTKEEWELHSEGSTSLPVIPVAWLKPGEANGDLSALPALEDLAHLNRRHWQASADQCELMCWVRAPGMYASGFSGEENIPWGPGVMTKLADPSATMGTIGVDAPSVEAGRVELKDLEERMALYGLQLLMPRTGDITATEKALNSSESDSTLKSWAMGLKDCLEQAMVYAAMWVGGDTQVAPSVYVNTEFHALMDADPQVLLLASERGVIPKRMVFDEFKRRGLLRDDADWQEALSEMENEARQAPGPSLASDAARRLLQTTSQAQQQNQQQPANPQNV